MNTEALIHSSLPPDLYLSERNCLHIRLRAARGDLESCGLMFFSRTSPERRKSCRMRLVLRDGQADYYETKIRFPRTARYLKYCFELEGKDGEKAWLNAWGVSKAMPSDGFFEFLYANENDCIRIPDWAKGQVYYHIFPERFCNGDRGNDPAGCVPWGSRPDRESCMGGDLAGIRGPVPVSDAGFPGRFQSQIRHGKLFRSGSPVRHHGRTQRTGGGMSPQGDEDPAGRRVQPLRDPLSEIRGRAGTTGRFPVEGLVFDHFVSGDGFGGLL